MTFKGKWPVCLKIVVNGQPREQISHFNFVGYDVSYDTKIDVTNKNQPACGTLHRTLHCKTTIKLKFYKVMAEAVLSYTCEK